jgi:hypothetical protein
LYGVSPAVFVAVALRHVDERTQLRRSARCQVALDCRQGNEHLALLVLRALAVDLTCL